MGGLSGAHPSGGSWPHSHHRRSGRSGMRTGRYRVWQPELAGCGIVRSCGHIAGFALTCQHRRLCHRSAQNQHHRHRRSGGPGRRLPQIHQRQPHPVPHEQLARCDRADGRGKGHSLAEPAIDHVRRLALHVPSPCSNTRARRFRLRGCRGRRPPSRKQHSLSRALRAPPSEPTGRFGNGHHLGPAARRRLLPAVLHISRRLADRWDIGDNNASQPSPLAPQPGLDFTGSNQVRRHSSPRFRSGRR
jgi:hypothetical protein